MQQDYILRIIEQFVQALVAVIRARKAGDYEQALEKIDAVSRRFLQLDLAALLRYGPQDLAEKFEREFDGQQAFICAEILHELSVILRAQQLEEGACRVESLCLPLYLMGFLREKTLRTESYRERIDGLLVRLGEHAPEFLRKNIRLYTDLDKY